MIDWLAERYVILWSKAIFFLENPTACPWIDFFQGAFVLIGVGIVLRAVYAAYRGWDIARRSVALECHPDRGDARKLAAAFARARDGLRRLAGAGGRLRWIEGNRLRLISSGEPVLCNIGIVTPRVLVSAVLVRKLSGAELEAALAHELSHVIRHDNLKRALMGAACLIGPMAFWMSDGLRLAVRSQTEFLAVLFLGLLAGLALRTIVVPAIAYWQERRADEWAAAACGDRLTVAAALVATAEAFSETTAPWVSFPATTFAFYDQPVSSRVRRLIEDRPPALMRLDRIVKRLVGLGVPVVAVLLAMAVHRAESHGLSGIIEITSCGVSLRVERPVNVAKAATTSACLRLPPVSSGS